MTNSEAQWQNVLQQVPEAKQFAGQRPEGLGGVVALLPPSNFSLAEILVAIQAFASGPAQKKLNRIRIANFERRNSIARKNWNSWKKGLTLFPAILVTVVGIVLLYPSSADLHDYVFDTGGPTVIVGLLGIVGLAAHLFIEWRSVPRSVPWTPTLYLAYAVMQSTGVVIYSIRVSNGYNWEFFSTTVGVILAGITAIGFVPMYFWARRRMSLFQALHSDTPQGREMDEALRDEVARSLAGRDDFDWTIFRTRSIEGVRIVVESGRINEDQAVWMVREIVDAEGASATK